jgi:hypothetical protein
MRKRHIKKLAKKALAKMFNGIVVELVMRLVEKRFGFTGVQVAEIKELIRPMVRKRVKY